MAEYEPLVIERAEGCRLIDIDGREYLDGASSMWCNVHGHRHPRIDAAIREQLDRVAHCTSLGMGCDTTVRLAKRLADIAPGDLEHVFFSSDGSSAVEVALKMAFQYWRQCENPQPREDEVHRARRSVSRRHDRQRERRRHRAVPRAVQAAAVRRDPRAAARSAPAAGGHVAERSGRTFSRRIGSSCCKRITTKLPPW